MIVSDKRHQVPLRAKLEDLFGLDLRSLALFRVGLALVIIADLVTTGLTQPPPGQFKLWDSSLLLSHPLVQGGLVVLTGLTALALLVGYRTRFMAISAWVLVLCVHLQNPVSMFTGNNTLPIWLFWGLFLPLGACYAIDSAMNTAAQKLPRQFVSVVTLALILQQCLIYWFYLPIETLPLLVGFIPLLLLIPWQTNLMRCWMVGGFILLDLGVALTQGLGLLPIISMISWLVFLPSWVWDRLYRSLCTPERQGLQIYYDAECGFCKKVVHLFRTFLILPGTPLLLAQSDPSIFADMEAYNSWVIVDWQGNRHFKFEAIIYVFSLSPLTWPLVPLLQSKPVTAVGTKFYETIATNRKAAGRLTKPFKFRPLEVRASPALNILALLFLTYAVVSTLRSNVL